MLDTLANMFGTIAYMVAVIKKVWRNTERMGTQSIAAKHSKRMSKNGSAHSLHRRAYVARDPYIGV